ncbi:SDR family oxidoreductase [Catellatospora sp. KI3]|nr:SDR family oxidoreductase [Catellatospora sp. KI3]MDI1460662.1 SDR family oxidoreductase [Catellatospora sp. KI3]
MPLTRSLPQSSVVVTGASSGIGAATALLLARRGARLTLTARDPHGLAEITDACRRVGALVAAVPLDVTDPDAVTRLAATARHRHGRLDAWINNAAVALYGSLLDTPLDEIRRTFDVDLYGYLHGARAAAPHLREAGGGVLVMVGSLLSELSMPHIGAYAVAKHAVLGLSDALRQELRGDRISVCAVLPGSVDTPLFGWAANRTGRAVRPAGPVVSPGRVAWRIARLLESPRRQVHVGQAAALAALQWRLAPGLVERVCAWYGRDAHFVPDRTAPPSTGNLFEPVPGGRRVTGGWRGRDATRAGAPATLAGRG